MSDTPLLDHLQRWHRERRWEAEQAGERFTWTVPRLVQRRPLPDLGIIPPDHSKRFTGLRAHTALTLWNGEDWDEG